MAIHSWITASSQLHGRCKDRRKLANNTYLERRNAPLSRGGETENSFAIVLHSTDIVTYYPDGSIDLCTGGYPTITTQDRMNRFTPQGYRISGEPLENRRNSSGMLVLSHANSEVCIDTHATINPDGTLDGGNVQQYREERREERNRARRPRNRARYWIAKATGLQVKRCDNRRWNCETRSRFARRNGLAVGSYACGCVVSFATSKPKNLTVESILQEDNATVRVAKMRIYGMERFFLDAKPEIIDTRAGYDLLSLTFGRWDNMRALKMSCPSTGAVYLNAVPPQTATVPDALNFMFDCEDYLGTLTQEA